MVEEVLLKLRPLPGQQRHHGNVTVLNDGQHGAGLALPFSQEAVAVFAIGLPSVRTLGERDEITRAEELVLRRSGTAAGLSAGVCYAAT
eukprot:scaffold803_cov310-Pinguiococcus_pyrenoidosus.AAC.72